MRLLPSGAMPMKDRYWRALTTAAVVGLSIAWLLWTVNGFTLADAEAYREASERLMAGEELYPLVADPDAPDVYRYAP